MRDYVFVAVLAVLIPTSFVRPWIGVLAWSWIAYMNPHRLTWSFAYSLPVAMMIALPTLAGMLISKDRKPIPNEPEMILLGVMAGFFTLTSFTAMVPDVVWQKWDQVMKILLFTFVTTMLIFGQERVRALFLTIALSIGFYGVKGAIFTLRTGGTERVYGPAQTFLGDNNSMGMAFTMVIPLLLALAVEAKSKWARLGLFAAAILSGLSAIFTYSRGAMLGLAAVALVLLLQSKRKILAVTVFAASVGFLYWFTPEQLYERAESIQTYEEDRSSMQRIQAWSVAFNIARDRPLTGGGFWIEYLPNEVWLSYADRTYDKFGQVARAAHSIYFQILGDQGFVGLGLFLALLSVSLFHLAKLSRLVTRGTPETRWIGVYATGVFAGLVGYTVAGAFLSHAYFDLFYAYVAIAAILSREAKLAAATARDSVVNTRALDPLSSAPSTTTRRASAAVRPYR